MNKAAAERSITELIEPECVSFSTPAEAEPRHIQQIIKTLHYFQLTQCAASLSYNSSLLLLVSQWALA